MLASLAFARSFRAAAYCDVEYSFGPRLNQYGAMVGGDARLLDNVSAFSHSVEFAGEWLWLTQRFVGLIHPDEFLFKADWRDGEPAALTLYCRFPDRLAPEAFPQALDKCRPFAWNAPPAASIAQALNAAGPRGAGLRVTAEGRLEVAIYFRLETRVSQFWKSTLARLVQACGLPANLASAVEEEIAPLYAPGPIGVIGIAAGDGASAGGIKFDPANVPLPLALRFASRRGAEASTLERLASIANSLRARFLNYFGVVYSAQGFAGWKMYIAVHPSAQRPAGAISLTQLQPVLHSFRSSRL